MWRYRPEVLTGKPAIVLGCSILFKWRCGIQYGHWSGREQQCVYCMTTIHWFSIDKMFGHGCPNQLENYYYVMQFSFFIYVI